MEKPTDVKDIFETHNIKMYLYGISYDKKVIKYGMSCPENHVMLGERLYRQIGHQKSWADNRIKGPCGAEWLMMEEEFALRYGVPIGNELNIKIWNFTNYNFISTDKRKEINSAEAELITKHRDHYRELPIGNLYDEEAAKDRPYIPQEVVSRLFE